MLWMEVPLMLTFLTINANGLHDDSKWQQFWQEIVHVDVICVQEMHLTPSQEYAFWLHAPGFDFFFEHGESNSAGVLVVVNRHKGVVVDKVTLGDGRYLVLDIKTKDQEMHLINLYAPNIPKSRKTFFQHIFGLCNSQTIMMGDFNSVEASLDCLSGNLDPTSDLLSSLLFNHRLKELDGSHKFSFT